MSCLLFVQLVVMILLLAGVIVTAVVQPPRNDRWLDLAIWKVSANSFFSPERFLGSCLTFLELVCALLLYPHLVLDFLRSLLVLI